MHIFRAPLSFHHLRPTQPLAQPLAQFLALWAPALMALALTGLALVAPAWAWPLLGAPLVEEVIFRAGLQTWLIDGLAAHARSGRLAPSTQAAMAIAITALAFAAAHLARHPGVPSALTVVPALLLGALYQQQRRLRSCVLLHSLFNGLWLLLPSFTAFLATLPPWMS